jgi:hypothetical protein
MRNLTIFLLTLWFSTVYSTALTHDALSPLSSRIKRDIDPLFILQDIIYSSSAIYSTPAHLAVAQGHIEFNLTNTAVPYETHCKADGLSRIPEFFYGDVVYQCDAPTGEGVGSKASANFTFAKADGTFNVNQTWGYGGYYTS